MHSNRISQYIGRAVEIEISKPQQAPAFVKAPALFPGMSPEAMAVQQEIYRRALDAARWQVIERDLFGE